MVCRLCLIDADKSIFIFSEEKIQKCIAKFLRLELSPEDPVSREICDCCWLQLDSFQDFCMQIEQAQKTLQVSIDESKQNEHISNAFNSEKGISANNNTLITLTESKVEITDDDFNDTHFSGDEISEAEIGLSPITDIDTIPLRRLTRSSTVKKYDCNDTLKTTPVRKQRGQPKKTDIQSVARATDNNDQNLLIEIPKKEHKEGSLISTNSVADLQTNKTRKRGRPKKGEPARVKKPRSEQITKMLQTAKEFDEIIQKNMNLSCNICSVRLIDFPELKRHYRAVHKCRGYAVCCNKRLFKRGLVVDHINVHNNPDYFKCPKCDKVLADRMCLRNHDLLFHQTDDAMTFQCPFCPKKYAKQYLLDHHTVKHIPQDECTFFCSECGKGFPTNATLSKHIKQIHLTLYDKMCEICAKLIRGNANFERHMADHEGIVEPQVQCKICGSWLKNKNSLRKHMYKHDGKTYVCKICNKKAPTKSALHSHMRYVHELSPMFHCTFCEKSFKKAVNLKEHLTTHTGEVLYTCPHCPKTFNSKANMHSHRKKKHREEWEANRRYHKKELKNEVT